MAFLLTEAAAQCSDVTLHARVDTSDREVMAVARLWCDYLASGPDRAYDNPYWNQAEKLRSEHFDLSARYLYQLPAQRLLAYYKPTVLSIEREGPHFGIRTLFQADGLEGEYRRYDPWCITKLYAVKEDGEWKLMNAMPIITQDWERYTLGRITFVQPPGSTFDQAAAERAVAFCDALTAEYGFPPWDPFDFYITASGDELGRLLNFDFFFPGYTTGMALSDERILLSGMGSPYYPHEFVHLVVPRAPRHDMVEEGFATWKGGTMGKGFEECAQLLAGELARNSTVSFSDVLDRKWGWNVAAYYTTGAILCQLAHDRGGVDAVKHLLGTRKDNAALMARIEEMFGVRSDKLDAFWREQVAAYQR